MKSSKNEFILKFEPCQAFIELLLFSENSVKFRLVHKRGEEEVILYSFTAGRTLKPLH